MLENIAAGQLAFTVDQQAYLQGAMWIYQLFLYNISGGLITPTDFNTGFKYVTKDTVDAYLKTRTPGKARARRRSCSPGQSRSASSQVIRGLYKFATGGF